MNQEKFQFKNDLFKIVIVQLIRKILIDKNDP